MLSPADAEAIILNLVRPLGAENDCEWTNLQAAGGRILAQAIAGPLDFPYWDNSAMDGYAVQHQDLTAVSPEQPAVLEVVEEIPAGHLPQKSITSGQAARIYTGSRMPMGADTVVMQENTRREGGRVYILEAPDFQADVRQQGSYYQAGSPLLSAGMQLGATDLAVLATVQCTQVPVYRRPQVAILSTGDELVAPDQPLGPAQVVDSNQYALAQLVRQTGAEVVFQERVGDDPHALKAAIQRAFNNADLVLSSGGVSVGDYDFVEAILAELGGAIHVRSVAVKPGKPLTVATFALEGRSRSLLYFGLPGNPVSALVSFWRFVQPALWKLSGRVHFSPTYLPAITEQELRGDTRRETYLWGQLRLHNGRFEFSLAAGSHHSANLINLAGTNGLAVVKPEFAVIPVGETVQVLQIGEVT